MSIAIERRLAKLEEAAHPDVNQIDIIIRRIVQTAGKEVCRAQFGDTVLDRREDETEDAFMERSKAQALASTGRRPCRVILLPEEVLQ